MTDREAMKMALEAFENPYSGWIQREKNAREALRQALAQPEQDWDLLAATQESLREHQARIKELEAQLAQPEQEELIQFKDGKWSYVRKPWVGLTDEDTANICMQGDLNDWHDEQVIDAVEAKLKELNT